MIRARIFGFILAFIIAASLATLVGGTAYLLIGDVSPPLEIYVSHASDEKGNVKLQFKTGETLYYFRRGTILRNIPRNVIQTLVNTDTGVVYLRLPLIPAATPKGSFAKVFSSVSLPDYLPEGNYSFNVTVEYSVNFLRNDERWLAPPIRFQVKK